MNKQDAASTFAGTADAVWIADELLQIALQHGADTLWIAPADTDLHTVTFERDGSVIMSAPLDGGAGDAVAARFAMIAEIDLLLPGARTGRSPVRFGSKRAELIATVRPTETGLSAELRLVLSRLSAPGARSVAAPAALTEGSAIGPYRIRRLLGHGGMGLVYAAQHTILRRDVAIKVMRRSVLESDPDAVSRFLREARTAARLRHPAIVEVFDGGTLDDGRPYLVMELLAGHPLGDIVDDEGALSPARAVRIAHRIAEALDAAHRGGVIHCDLSASNVFLLDDESVKLVDFGAASTAEDGSGDNGMVMGTPSYMAPEQIRGNECTAQTDLYALGALLYEMLAGQPPFLGSSALEVVHQHVYEPAPEVESPHEALSVPLVAVVSRLLRKRPEERFPSAAELCAALGRIERSLSRTGWRRWLP